METRSWWNRSRNQWILLGLAVLAAWLVRQTQGAALYEMYYWLTRPFHLATSTVTEQEKIVRQIAPRINQLEAQIQELQTQNQKFQELLNYVASKKQDKGIVAPVIGRSADSWWKQIIIGRGSQQGIQNQDLVVAPGGLIGRVISVTPNTSTVMLLSDPMSRIGVTVSRSRNMGFLKGNATEQGVMEFFESDPNVKLGDVVVTSAFSQIVPAGLPIGKVISLDMNKAPAPEAIVEFFAPISSLEWVIIYPNAKKSSESQKSSNPSVKSIPPEQ
ncbi:rod shape-determining protein MreC [Planktothrix mougeotii]|uniref:Cell shape-determining protein MreC n=1 Tax=Planktothrix mougeotii LEGE 06226 TaxID=1828728 RepID=A0ABR9UH65_9CYAN|nr:rod shape-determining protein MreC [Planktothrix mougeotii]MBE9145459.1 rod shape-determining protein MreC [Planktothrix mougeotii LEGE 06226]